MKKSTAKKSKVAAKKTKTDLFTAKRKRVEEATDLLAAFDDAKRTAIIGEICVRHLGGSCPPELEELLRSPWGEVRSYCLSSVRSYVEDDQTVPIAAGFVGRALQELLALAEESAVTRIGVFAFFACGDASGVLVEPEHRKVAKDCKDANEATAKGRPLPAATTLTSRDKASKALSKPLERLQDLGLTEATGVFAGKDSSTRGNYLINCGRQVFDGWPEWPPLKRTV